MKVLNTQQHSEDRNNIYWKLRKNGMEIYVKIKHLTEFQMSIVLSTIDTLSKKNKESNITINSISCKQWEDLISTEILYRKERDLKLANSILQALEASYYKIANSNTIIAAQSIYDDTFKTHKIKQLIQI